MRLYDPEDDLPPRGVLVYCLIEYDNTFCTQQLQDKAKWCPYNGWTVESGTRVRVLRWTDYPIPDMSQDFKRQKKEEKKRDKKKATVTTNGSSESSKDAK